MNSTSSTIVFDKPGLAAPRGKQERDGGVVVKFSGRSTPVGVKLSQCGIVSNSATLLYHFSSEMASDMLSFYPAVPHSMIMFPVPLSFCLWALMILGCELSPKALSEVQLLT